MEQPHLGVIAKLTLIINHLLKSKYGLMDRNRSVRIEKPDWLHKPPFIENGDASFLYLDVLVLLTCDRNVQAPNMFPSLELFIQPTPRHKRKVATTPHNIQAHPHYTDPPPFPQSTLPHRARLSKSLRVLDIGRQALLHLLLLGRQLDRQFLGGLRI